MDEMLALVFDTDRELRLERRPIPRPGPGEVLARPLYCGICGTDLHAAQLGDLFRPGVVLGHEFSVQVVEVGPGVEGWRPGDRASVNPNGNVCGRCDACRSA